MGSKDCIPPEDTILGTWHWLERGKYQAPACWLGGFWAIANCIWAPTGRVSVITGTRRGLRYLGPVRPWESIGGGVDG